MFARQIDGVVGEPEGDPQRKVGELDRLGEDDVVVAVLAGERGGVSASTVSFQT